MADHSSNASLANTSGSPVDEALCTHCGKCCYKKIIIGRTVFITPFPCEFLDTSTNLCTIYERRHELNPLCLSVRAGLKVSAFPADCPYVPAYAAPGYRPARDDWDWSQEWDGFDELADDLDVAADMREKIRARGPHAPPMYVETNERLLKESRCEVGPASVPVGNQIPPAGTPALPRTPVLPVLWGAQAPAVIDLSAPPSSADSPPAPRLADMARRGAGRLPVSSGTGMEHGQDARATIAEGRRP